MLLPRTIRTTNPSLTSSCFPNHSANSRTTPSLPIFAWWWKYPTTLGFDLTTKARLYARARIVEHWVVDIPGRRIIVHRDPQGGQYPSVIAYAEQESVKPLASSDSEFPVGSAFAG